MENTNAFLKLKEQVQSSFNFAIAVCHAIPCLKQQLNLLENGTVKGLPRPDYYDQRMVPDRLKDQVQDYKSKLATYLFLSTFAFFESYIENVVKEICSNEMRIPEQKSLKATLDNAALKHPKKLLSSGGSDNRRLDRYEKYSQELRKNNYIPPKDLIAIVSTKKLIKTVEDLKANEIPSFLVNTFAMTIPQDVINMYGEYRGLRNEIAHGENPVMTLRKVKEANKFFRKFASNIDMYLAEHYIRVPNYIENS